MGYKFVKTLLPILIPVPTRTTTQPFYDSSQFCSEPGDKGACRTFAIRLMGPAFDISGRGAVVHVNESRRSAERCS